MKKRWVHALAAIRDDSSTAMLRKILALQLPGSPDRRPPES